MPIMMRRVSLFAFITDSSLIKGLSLFPDDHPDTSVPESIAGSVPAFWRVQVIDATMFLCGLKKAVGRIAGWMARAMVGNPEESRWAALRIQLLPFAVVARFG
nr:hypothetical protein [uncultured Propionivibrio sp.]